MSNKMSDSVRDWNQGKVLDCAEITLRELAQLAYAGLPAQDDRTR